jgi:hypothetical protein
MDSRVRGTNEGGFQTRPYKTRGKILSPRWGLKRSGRGWVPGVDANKV